jgi:hypothetical protein
MSNAEVLIYVERVKHYLKTNEEARNYFIVNGNEDMFFTRLSKISEKNFEKNGEPELTKEQMESLRIDVVLEAVDERPKYRQEGIYFIFENYPPTSLN